MTALRNYGLDIKSENFLVSQNYVECIAMKTPKELTAMFEQICGSNVYKGIYNRYIFLSAAISFINFNRSTCIN